MKQSILTITLLTTLSILILGCGQPTTKSQKMATENNKRIQINIQNSKKAIKDKAPGMSKLSNNILSEEAKEFSNLLNIYIKDSTTIPSRLVNPNTSLEAMEINRVSWKKVKLNMYRQVKINNLSKKQQIMILKKIKRNLTKPFYIMTETPQRVSTGYIRNNNKINKIKKFQTVFMEIPYGNQLKKDDFFNKLSSSFEEFLTKNNGWLKKINPAEKYTKIEIEENNFFLAQEEQELKELLEVKKTSSSLKRIKALQKSISETKNTITYHLNRLGKIDKYGINSISYTYQYKSTHKYSQNSIMVDLHMQNNYILITFMKIIYE